MTGETTAAPKPSSGLVAGARNLARDIAAAWQTFPFREAFWLLLLAWILLFQFFGNSTLGYVKTSSLFGWMIYSYEMNPDDAHGYFIPALVLMLLWWKKAELLPLEKRICWPALALFIAAIALHLLGFLAQQTRLSIAGFYLGVYALTGLLWGGAWLAKTIFPFCLLAFCVPIGTLTEAITFPLRQAATTLTVMISHGVLQVEVIQQGTRIYDPTGQYQYEIAAACSGIRSLTALFVLTMIYGFLFFQKFWQRGLIVLLAVPAALISNVLRLLMIVGAAEIFGQQGGNYVHDSTLLSFLPYVVGFCLVYGAGRLLTRRQKKEAA